jgi:hypothetical protein
VLARVATPAGECEEARPCRIPTSTPCAYDEHIAGHDAYHDATPRRHEDFYTNYMWGSDYPDTDGAFQFSTDREDTPVTHVAQRFAFWGAPEEPLRAMLGETAAAVDGLDLAALRDVARRINAATVEELRETVHSAPAGVNSLTFRRYGWWD